MLTLIATEPDRTRQFVACARLAMRGLWLCASTSWYDSTYRRTSWRWSVPFRRTTVARRGCRRSRNTRSPGSTATITIARNVARRSQRFPEAIPSKGSRSRRQPSSTSSWTTRRWRSSVGASSGSTRKWVSKVPRLKSFVLFLRLE